MSRATSSRVLVIEDDAVVRALLSLALEDEGWRVLETSHALDPTDIAQLRPDVVVLDLRLGGSDDGWQLLEDLRGTPGARAIPVVVCTGDRERARTESDLLLRLADRVLLKPFELDELFEAVGRPTNGAPPPIAARTARV